MSSEEINPVYFVTRWVGGEIGISSSITEHHPLDFKNCSVPFGEIVSWKELSLEDVKIMNESRVGTF